MGFMSKDKQLFTEFDYKALNNIKTLSIDMIHEAGSGHPGIALGAAPIIYDIYARHLVFNPKDDKWINRDRFIMSAGHGSALLYATLYMSGFDIKLDDLKKFRKYGSITPGHPELGVTPGVDISTGPLGQGFANAVGIAISERFLNKKFTYSGNNSLINHYTYVLCGDGDLMEGVSYEAASIAGNLGLNKLIVLYDSNNITLDRNTSETFKENVLDRFKAMNWNTLSVSNGTDLNSIDEAVTKAKQSDRPTIIEVKTIIGNGSKMQNTPDIHGTSLTEEDISNLKKTLDIRDIPFSVSNDAYNYLTDRINNRNNPIIENYNKILESNITKIPYKDDFESLSNGTYKINTNNLTIDLQEELALRDISKIVLNKIVREDTLSLVGSADVAKSTKLYVDNLGDFTNTSYKGRNILFGVREHAMGAILNGIASTGIKVFGSTFLVFSDYLKPSIRMAALMNLPVIYIFTHDSILVGEDGPTHQPVEQLISLRSIPNLVVYRPADENEVLGAYKSALNRQGPSVIVVSKEKTNSLECTNIKEVDKGGYIVKDFDKIMGVIISSGSELKTALSISNTLEKNKMYLRVVSMPSIEKFESQDEKYKERILPLTTKKFVIEFSSSYSWYKYVYNEKYLFNVNEFGKSGNKNDILEKYHLDEKTLTGKIEKLIQ